MTIKTTMIPGAPRTNNLSRLFASLLITFCSTASNNSGSSGRPVIIFAEGARHQRQGRQQQYNGHYHGGNTRRGGGGGGRRSTQHHPASRGNAGRGGNGNYGFSPNFEMYETGDEEEDATTTTTSTRIKSFYERNGLDAPPLVSRAERMDRKRRALQEESEPLFGNGNNDNDNNSSSSNNDNNNNNPTASPTAELQSLIRNSKSPSEPATDLRADLLKNAPYDRHAYPRASARNSFPSADQVKTGTPVEFSLNFHRVFSVDIVNSVMDLVVWCRIEWSDPRLTWRPEEYGNLTKSWFWIGDGGSGGETSEIWTPDIELWNLEEGLRDSFDDAYAIVSNDGSVYWSRPGHLRPVCKFYGLHTFPFDRLTCTMEFGSWAYSGKYLRMVKGLDTGFSVGGSETAGATFNEYSFVEEDPVTCRLHVYPPYPSSPEEDWPVLMYNITIERSWQPYVRGYITMQVLLNIIGFSAFWLPPSCGERMGLSITAMLAAVAAEIVVASNLPAAAEYTWFQKFSILSMAFAFVSLIESVIVLYFYYKRSEDMIPWWFTEFRKWYIFRQARKRSGQVLEETARRTSNLASETSNLVNKQMDSLREGVKNRRSSNEKHGHDPKYDDDESFSENERDSKIISPGEDSSVESFEEEKKDKVAALQMQQVLPGDLLKDPTKLYDVKKTESTQGLDSILNSTLASGSHGDGDSVDLSDKDIDFGVVETGRNFADSMISDLGFDDSDPNTTTQLQPSKRQRRGVRRGQSPQSQSKTVQFLGKSEEKSSRQSEVHPLTRLSLVPQASRRTMMRQFQENGSESVRSIMVPRDADDFNNEEEVESNKKWKHIAARIDDVARFWIPVSFFISLSIILSQVVS